MRSLFRVLVLLLAAVASPAMAMTYGFGFISLTGSTGIGGTVTASVKVPGTFATLAGADMTQGRFLKSAFFWTDSPAAGDQLTALQVVDTDGVIPSPMRAALPNYPVVLNLIDTATGGTSAVFIPPNGYTAEAFDTNGNDSARFIPGGLYLSATYQAGGLGIAKTFRAVIRWGIWQ